MFGNGGKDVDRQPVRGGEVSTDEFNARFHEHRDERHVARQPVELSHDKDGLVPLAVIQGAEKFRAVLPLSALHFDELGSRDVPGDRYPLSIDTVTINALLHSGADPQVVGVFRGSRFHVTVHILQMMAVGMSTEYCASEDSRNRSGTRKTNGAELHLYILLFIY